MKVWLFSIAVAIYIFVMIEGILAMAWAIVTLYWWCLFMHPVIFSIVLTLIIGALSALLRKYAFDDED